MIEFFKKIRERRADQKRAEELRNLIAMFDRIPMANGKITPYGWEMKQNAIDELAKLNERLKAN